MSGNRQKILAQVIFLMKQKRIQLQAFGFTDCKTARTILKRIESRDPQGLSVIFSFLIVALGSSADRIVPWSILNASWIAMARKFFLNWKRIPSY